MAGIQETRDPIVRKRPIGRLIVGLLLAAAAGGLIVATVIPLVRTDQWWVRIFDFPRLQFAVLMIVVLLGYGGLWFWSRWRRWEYIFPVLLGLSLAWQLYCILPYSPLFPVQVADHRNESPEGRLSVLIANVLHNNRDAAALLEVIRDADPDVILLLEPTDWWQEQLAELEQRYPHTLFQPLDNHYGMLLYSRLELVDPEIRFLIESQIPSARTGVRLRSGEVVSLYGLHPRPPGLAPPGEDERKDSDLRDGELLLVAREVAPLNDTPVIVAGDFNDVGWSHTTSLFQKVGGLLDPRIGRGLYNTFDADNPLLRYPLDHIFVSDHFRLVELRRLPYFGSDHFAVLTVLEHDPAAAAQQDEPTSDAGDVEEAEEAIEKVR